VSEALPACACGKKIEIWFQDEARVGQKGTLTRLWAKRGTRPRATRDTRYEWAYIFGAVCPERSIGAALVMPYADGAALNAHLRELASSVAADAHADGERHRGDASGSPGQPSASAGCEPMMSGLGGDGFYNFRRADGHAVLARLFVRC